MFFILSYILNMQYFQPTLLKDKVDEQTVFYSMAVHSLTAAMSCPAAMFIIKLVHTKLFI